MAHNDERDFDALFEAHYRDVLRYVLRRAPLASAEDVLAETFLVAWRRADQIPDDPLPWLLGVARRVLANQRRGELRRDALLGRLRATSTGEVGAWQPPSTVGPELAGALASLPDREREALLLLAWEGLDIPQAAVAAGCSTATFRVRLHRARKRVARQLARPALDSSLTRTSEKTL
jgi:DNA-directed RNA polymerase specialized sigma24 family protein